MNIDQRLEFLLQSSRSLHANCQQLHAMMREQAEQTRQTAACEAKLRRALLDAVAAFLDGLEDDGQPPDEQ